jgi:5-methylcytosine-specific restriction endonuclease McrA
MHRTTAYAIRKRDAIFEVLGTKCAACGANENLEFDVIVPQDMPKSHHGDFSFAQRMVFYCRQLSAGNLQVLCSACNSRKWRGTTRFIQPLIGRKPSHRNTAPQPF